MEREKGTGTKEEWNRKEWDGTEQSEREVRWEGKKEHSGTEQNANET